jgi:hypothetical protein
MPLCKWQLRMRRLMSSRKRIRQAKSGSGAVLWPGRFQLQRRSSLDATFLSACSGLSVSPRLLLHRRPAANAEHDESPVKIVTAVRIGSLADDRATSLFL